MNAAPATSHHEHDHSRAAYARLLPYEQQLADAWAGLNLDLRSWLVRQSGADVHPVTDFELMAPEAREAIRHAAWKTARLAGQVRGMLV